MRRHISMARSLIMPLTPHVCVGTCFIWNTDKHHNNCFHGNAWGFQHNVNNIYYTGSFLSFRAFVSSWTIGRVAATLSEWWGRWSQLQLASSVSPLWLWSSPKPRNVSQTKFPKTRPLPVHLLAFCKVIASTNADLLSVGCLWANFNKVVRKTSFFII